MYVHVPFCKKQNNLLNHHYMQPFKSFISSPALWFSRHSNVRFIKYFEIQYIIHSVYLNEAGNL